MQRTDGSGPRAHEVVPALVHMGQPARHALMAGHGSVLAALSSALYLESVAGIACLVSPPAPRGPLNVVLCGFKPGTRGRSGATWRTDGTTLAIDGLGTFSISAHKEWLPPPLPSVCLATLLAGLASMRAILEARVPRGEVLVHALRSLPERPAIRAPWTASRPGSMDAHFARAVPALSRWLDDALAGRNASIPGPVAALLGAGRGFTPSGDDCIAGVLVALHALGERRTAASVARVVARYAPRRTSRLSAAHLDAACAGEAIEPLHAAIEAIAGNTSPGPVLDALERFGHGSGFDGLAGVLVATHAIAHNRASTSHVHQQRPRGRGTREGPLRARQNRRSAPAPTEPHFAQST